MYHRHYRVSVKLAGLAEHRRQYAPRNDRSVGISADRPEFARLLTSSCCARASWCSYATTNNGATSNPQAGSRGRRLESSVEFNVSGLRVRRVHIRGASLQEPNLAVDVHLHESPRRAMRRRETACTRAECFTAPRERERARETSELDNASCRSSND